MQAAPSMGPAEGRKVAFGDFTFDRVTQILRRQDLEVPLPPRVLGVLTLLLDRPGEVVTKQALISAVWRDAFVTETSIAEAVSVLRQALGDDTQRPTYVQTLHRRGYRFIADLRVADPAAPAAREALAPMTPPDTAPAPEPRLSLLVPWLITGFALLTAASAVWRYVDASAPAAEAPVQFAIALPDGLAVPEEPAPLAISRDGALLAFSACDAARCGLYLRPLSQPDATLLAGTAGARAPFFSPDGRSLGFFAGGRLQRLALGGGSPEIVAESASALGATWLADGQIVFAPAERGGLSVVRADGGGARQLTTAGEGEGHRWPIAMRDDSAVLFTVQSTAGGEAYGAVATTGTGAWARLLDTAGAVAMPAPEYLVAQRGSGLVAARLDARARSIVGLPVSVPASRLPALAPQFAVSDTGALVTVGVDRRSLQVVLHWSGELRRLVPAPQPALPR